MTFGTHLRNSSCSTGFVVTFPGPALCPVLRRRRFPISRLPAGREVSPAQPVTNRRFHDRVRQPHWSQSDPRPRRVLRVLQPSPDQGSGRGPGPFYTKTGLSLNLDQPLPSANSWSVGARVHVVLPELWGPGKKKAGQMQFRFTLTDGTRTRSVFHKTQRVKVTNKHGRRRNWQEKKSGCPSPQGVAGFLYNAVDGFTRWTVLNHGSGDLRYADPVPRHDRSRSPVTRPPGLFKPNTGRGVWTWRGIVGTARVADGRLQVTQGAGVFTETTEKSSRPAAPKSWLWPRPVTRGWVFAQVGPPRAVRGGPVERPRTTRPKRGGGGRREHRRIRYP